MSQAENNRQDKRQECYVPVNGKLGSDFDQTCTVDISQGGIGLVSNRQVFVDERIIVALQFHPKEEPVLTAGKVKWVQKIQDSGNYRIGMQLMNESEIKKSMEDF